ncbi:MAG: serine/threonine-protein kinase [Kofleriaceae bacterium]|nr:serine/threonine-protein kinase [Kofleriaceae bacterium]
MARSDDENDALANTMAAATSEPPPISGLEPTVAPSSQRPPMGTPRPGATRVVGEESADHAELPQIAAADYALGEELARGGMGRIRKARDLRLGRPVAVKELLVSEPETVERFEREIRLTARLQHPSIVSVYEAGRWPSGEAFYAMRMVPGKSLDRVIAPLTKLADRLALLPNVIAIVEALAYAHDQRIIHRDLKPGNVLIGPFGETVVIDWGLAKDLASSEPSLEPAVRAKPDDKESAGDLTMAGAVMGTPAYMPPEQAAGEPLDERADVYALGAILYHVLGGRAPFTGKTSEELLIKVLSKTPTPVRELAEGIPTDLTTIVAKAMARDPAARYATARELAADLKRFQTGQLVGAHSYSRWQLVKRWLNRHRGAVTVGALSLVALAVIGVLSVRNVVRERDRAEAASQEAERQRVSAIAAKDEAVLASARLHFDQGRQELLDGHPLRAAVLARAALVEDTPATRLLAGLSLAPLTSLVRRFEPLHEPILAAGFTSDGSSVFAATWLGKIRFWDTATGRRTASFDRGSRLTDAGLSPDATTLLVLGDDSEIEVWDTRAGTQRGTITIPGGIAYRADFSPDGRVIAVTGDALTLWNTETLKQIATGPALPDDLMAVLRWSPDGTLVALGGASHGSIAIVETARWNVKVSVKARGNEIRDFGFTLDGKRLAYVTDESGAVIDSQTGAELVTLDGSDQQRANRYRAIEVSLDGSALAISTLRDNAKLIDARTGKLKRVLPGYATLRFSGDGTKLLSFGVASGKLGLWDVATGSLLDELAGHAHEIGDASFSPSGAHILSASNDGSLALWKVNRSPNEARMTLRQRARDAVFSPDGGWLVTAGDDGTADVYNAHTGDFVRTFGTHRDVPADPIVEIVGTNRLLTTLGAGQAIELWDLASGARIAGFDARSVIRRASVIADGTRVYAATHTEVIVWDATSGKEIARFTHPEPEGDPPVLPGHQAAGNATFDGQRVLVPAPGGVAVHDVATKARRGLLTIKGDVWSTCTSPTSDRAVVIGEEGTTMFDLTTHKPIASLSAQGEVVLDVRFDADGRNLYTRGSDSTIRRWDAETGVLEATSQDEEGMVLQMFALQPGGALIATFSSNLVRLWDTRTGKLLAERDTTLDANGMGTLLAFSPDGKLVASSYGGVLWTWTLPSWKGTPEALDAILARDVPWTLVDGTLKPRALE